MARSSAGLNGCSSSGVQWSSPNLHQLGSQPLLCLHTEYNPEDVKTYGELIFSGGVSKLGSMLLCERGQSCRFSLLADVPQWAVHWRSYKYSHALTLASLGSYHQALQLLPNDADLVSEQAPDLQIPEAAQMLPSCLRSELASCCSNMLLVAQVDKERSP